MTVSESDVILTKDMWRYIEVGDIGIKRDQAKAKKVMDQKTRGIFYLTHNRMCAWD